MAKKSFRCGFLEFMRVGIEKVILAQTLRTGGSLRVMIESMYGELYPVGGGGLGCEGSVPYGVTAKIKQSALSLALLCHLSTAFPILSSLIISRFHPQNHTEEVSPSTPFHM